METAAKKKNSLALVVIASMIAWVSTCLLSSAAIASSASASLLGHATSIERSSTTIASATYLVGPKSRAEIFLGTSLKSIERSELNPVIATRYYDSLEGVALECLVAPVSGANQAPQLLLGHTPTTNTLSQVRNMRQPAKWQAGEQYVQELYGSAGQQHFAVPGTGGRFVDAPVARRTGVLAAEVKTYGQWRTVQGVAQQQTVPLSAHIEQQILKDVWLRQNVRGYDPRWIFLDAPPSAEVSALLRQHRIVSVTYQ